MRALHPNGLLVLTIGALVMGCSRAPAPRAGHHAAVAAQQPRVDRESLAAVCPFHVAGTQAAPEAVEYGAAYVFTTSTDVAELRRRVRVIARLHGERDGLIAATDDLPTGVRLNVRPADSTKIEQLQQAARRIAPRLAHGSCPNIRTGDMVAWLVAAPDINRDAALSSR